MADVHPLARLRKKLKLSFGAVERRSQEIAIRERNSDFIITKSRLFQAEQGSTLGPHKILALAEIYAMPVDKLVRLLAGKDKS